MSQSLCLDHADTAVGQAIAREAAKAGWSMLSPASGRESRAVIVAPAPVDRDDGLIDVSTTQAFARLVDRDLGRTMRLLRAALPSLIASRGSIVLVAMQGADALAQAVSAGALATLAKSIAYQYGPQGVRANVIEMEATTDADDVARLALFLVSPDASYMTGCVLRADHPHGG